jgi:hypothetical protein
MSAARCSARSRRLVRYSTCLIRCATRGDLSRLPTRVPAALSLADWLMPFCVAWALLLKFLSRCTESPMMMGSPRLVPLAWKSSTYVERRRPVPVDLCRRCCTYAIPFLHFSRTGAWVWLGLAGLWVAAWSWLRVWGIVSWNGYAFLHEKSVYLGV